MKKQIFILIIILLFAIKANAQTITGIVVDENSKPVIAANVVLQDSAQQNIAGIETNNYGRFILQNISPVNRYKLS
ncbi:MAG: carboxypeptidase-like regulatory domain-containing protein, partial [Prevotellaceae bacterium]|nr:carboxypeptidase-like regulatory domain-containing protein [Prevotellaceae bacterium]